MIIHSATTTKSAVTFSFVEIWGDPLSSPQGKDTSEKKENPAGTNEGATDVPMAVSRAVAPRDRGIMNRIRTLTSQFFDL